MPEYLKERMPVFKHDLIDISKYKEEDFEKYEPLTKMVLRPLRYIFEKDDDILLEKLLISVEEVSEKEEYETIYYYIEMILTYFSSVKKDISEEKLKRKIEELEGKGDIIMTILQEKELKGKKEGEQIKAREIAKKALKEGMEDSLIIKLTGLSKEEIEKLK